MRIGLLAAALLALGPGLGRSDEAPAKFTSLFNGRDLTKMDPVERRHMRGRNIAMIFQEPMTSLNPVLTVRTQLVEAVQRSQDGPGDTKLTKAQQVARAVEALRLAEMPDPELAMLTPTPSQSGRTRTSIPLPSCV